MQKLESFGIIPIHKKNSKFYILLVKNSKGGHWGLPKGTPELNEVPLETAVRELEEETGITEIKIKESITFKESYVFEQNKKSYNKTNTYFIGFVSKMDLNNNLDEIDEIKWVEIDKAKDILTYQSSADTINSLYEYLSKLEL